MRKIARSALPREEETGGGGRQKLSAATVVVLSRVSSYGIQYSCENIKSARYSR